MTSLSNKTAVILLFFESLELFLFLLVNILKFNDIFKQTITTIEGHLVKTSFSFLAREPRDAGDRMMAVSSDLREIVQRYVRHEANNKSDDSVLRLGPRHL
ncbi:hypothetical protein BgiBS90_012429 [Biomphalaria glabrata]|nr:hypothetical protein BgiBS90_012429 [Biomphalaria glabrata]